MTKKQSVLLCIVFMLFLPLGYLTAWLLFRDVYLSFFPSYATWPVQSIDTMKFSRDLALVKLNDPSFDTTINEQMMRIYQTGATYVSIATPYDPMFVPMLNRWVRAARNNHLKVWFRGNFTGWEGWFNSPRISGDQHKTLLTAFISKNPQLFEDGDIFTPCPECENGGSGDPRKTGDANGFRRFLIDEYSISQNGFAQMGKHVSVGYFSMNYDVARLVMDPATTKSLGGIVTVDHYVKTPGQLVTNVRELAKFSGGKILLGELGAPIPDINGDMTEGEQAAWLQQTLTMLAAEPEVFGVNYWVGFGGTTKLWNDDGSARAAVPVLASFYTKLKGP